MRTQRIPSTIRRKAPTDEELRSITSIELSAVRADICADCGALIFPPISRHRDWHDRLKDAVMRPRRLV